MDLYGFLEPRIFERFYNNKINISTKALIISTKPELIETIIDSLYNFGIVWVAFRHTNAILRLR